LRVIAIPDESSIIETGMPLLEIREAILYPSVLRPYTATFNELTLTAIFNPYQHIFVPAQN
jgi:hypothetical protein